MKTTAQTQTREDLLDAALSALYDLVLLRLSGAVGRWVEDELTFAQLKALIVLSRYGDRTLGQLAKALGTGSSAASILVQQLVVRGLVNRDEDSADRRRTVLRLTDRGATLVAGRRKDRESQLRHWLDPLSDAELRGLEHGLSILHDRMQSELAHREAAIRGEKTLA